MNSHQRRVRRRARATPMLITEPQSKFWSDLLWADASRVSPVKSFGDRLISSYVRNPEFVFSTPSDAKMVPAFHVVETIKEDMQNYILRGNCKRCNKPVLHHMHMVHIDEDKMWVEVLCNDPMPSGVES